MTTDDRKALAADIREALSLAEQRRSVVVISQFSASLILELLNDSDPSDTLRREASYVR